ncbi:MAG: multidrug efflux RND transporter permease subunit [Acidobacteriia bacterium]|nr:multidrug efflux RND transporter permease subunit [Terriglobia bacterium]
MNISELFIRRPVMTTLVMLGVMLFGIMAYRLLPVSDLPNVDFPTILVTASLPGASPETMASSVATPLEREFSTIAGIDSMTSTSSLGSTSITVQFNLARNLDAAAQDVQAAIARANRNLPQNMPFPPSYQKVNPADTPILYIALTSSAIPIYQLDEYGETLMAQRISTVSGVAQVQVYGSQKYAVRIQLDPDQLATRGIGIDQVEQAVQTGNVNLPTGTLWGPHTAFTVQANGQLMKAGDYRPLIVAYRNGSPVRLSDLGQVIDSVENDKTAAWEVDQRAVILAIQRQPGTNTVEVSQAVQSLMPTFRAQLPASVSMKVLYDRAASIRNSVNDVKFTLLFTLALVVMVIFLFLRNLSATMIPSLSMPLSIVGTFAVMYMMGYSLDNLSLMAIVLSLGFVVDDAIVMLENVVRHMEHGEHHFAAALAGSKEIGFTILSMTLSLAAVFIPVLFMGGIIGRLFHEFAVTIGVSVLISGLVSLTLTPMLSSRFLRPPGEERHGAFYQFFERFFEGMLRLYERGLTWSLRHQTVVMATAVAITVATVGLFVIVPKGFIPSEDTGQIFGFTEAAEGVSFDEMVRHQKAIAEVVKADPNAESFMSSAGGRAGFGSNVGIVFIRLTPRSKRTLSADEVINELRPKLAQVPGIRVYMQNPPPIRIGGQLTKSQYQLTLQGPDTADLYRVAPLLEARMRQLPGLVDVNSDLQIKNPEVNVNIDRDKAAALGVTPAAVEDALYSAYGTRQISTIYTPTNQYRVLMELQKEHQADPSVLSELYVRSSGGQLVPLESVSRFDRMLGPLSVNHLGQLPAVTLSFNLRPGVSLGDAVQTVTKAARDIIPASVSTSFQGTAQAFQSSLSGLGLLLLMAVVVIYIVLGILYESFIHPITILSALPLAGFGALATLLIFRVDLSIYAFVGIIMLVGLVKKNGIIMIDFALEAQRKEGKQPADAIYEACVVRFRPIMMTTMAALFGTLPVALGIGAGAESRRPLGLAVVGGIVFSQLLTLFVTPVVFLFMDRVQVALSRWLPFLARGRGAEEGEQPRLADVEPLLAATGTR